MPFPSMCGLQTYPPSSGMASLPTHLLWGTPALCVLLLFPTVHGSTCQMRNHPTGSDSTFKVLLLVAPLYDGLTCWRAGSSEHFAERVLQQTFRNSMMLRRQGFSLHGHFKHLHGHFKIAVTFLLRTVVDFLVPFTHAGTLSLLWYQLLLPKPCTKNGNHDDDFIIMMYMVLVGNVKTIRKKKKDTCTAQPQAIAKI